MNIYSSYADSLMELSIEENCEAEVYEACTILSEELKKSPDYIKIISSPVIPAKDKMSLLLELLADVPTVLRNTILLLCEKNEVQNILKILDKFIEGYCDKHGIVTVDAITAVHLSEPMRLELTKTLEMSMGKKILLNNRIDPLSLGGLKIQIDGKQFDGTLERQLLEIREKMAIK